MMDILTVPSQQHAGFFCAVSGKKICLAQPPESVDDSAITLDAAAQQSSVVRAVLVSELPNHLITNDGEAQSAWQSHAEALDEEDPDMPLADMLGRFAHADWLAVALENGAPPNAAEVFVLISKPDWSSLRWFDFCR